LYTNTDDLLIYIKRHKTENGVIIAMCDERLIGKVISEGEVVIDIQMYADFYKGELIEAKDAPAAEEIDGFSSANIVGDEACRAAVKLGMIDAKRVRKVGGVPFAQSFRVKG
jgi:Uncharacterized conserved protein